MGKEAQRHYKCFINGVPFKWKEAWEAAHESFLFLCVWFESLAPWAWHQADGGQCGRAEPRAEQSLTGALLLFDMASQRTSVTFWKVLPRPMSRC